MQTRPSLPSRIIINEVTRHNQDILAPDLATAMQLGPELGDALSGKTPDFTPASHIPALPAASAQSQLLNEYLESLQPWLSAEIKHAAEQIADKRKEFHDQYAKETEKFAQDFTDEHCHGGNNNLALYHFKRNIAVSLMRAAYNRLIHFAVPLRTQQNIRMSFNEIFNGIASIQDDGALVVNDALPDEFAQLDLQQIQARLSAIIKTCNDQRSSRLYLSEYLQPELHAITIEGKNFDKPPLIAHHSTPLQLTEHAFELEKTAAAEKQQIQLRLQQLAASREEKTRELDAEAARLESIPVQVAADANEIVELLQKHQTLTHILLKQDGTNTAIDPGLNQVQNHQKLDAAQQDELIDILDREYPAHRKDSRIFEGLCKLREACYARFSREYKLDEVHSAKEQLLEPLLQGNAIIESLLHELQISSYPSRQFIENNNRLKQKLQAMQLDQEITAAKSCQKVVDSLSKLVLDEVDRKYELARTEYLALMNKLDNLRSAHANERTLEGELNKYALSTSFALILNTDLRHVIADAMPASSRTAQAMRNASTNKPDHAAAKPQEENLNFLQRHPVAKNILIGVAVVLGIAIAAGLLALGGWMLAVATGGAALAAMVLVPILGLTAIGADVAGTAGVVMKIQSAGEVPDTKPGKTGALNNKEMHAALQVSRDVKDAKKKYDVVHKDDEKKEIAKEPTADKQEDVARIRRAAP